MKISHLDFLKNRFNAAAWNYSEKNETVLMLREVSHAANIGEPDRGRLIRLVVNREHQLLQQDTIWSPTADNFHLEDPRALVLPDGFVMVGLTAVRKSKETYLPYPAIAILNEQTRSFNRMNVIDEFGPGKNLTPFDPATWVFRREADPHKLLVLHWDSHRAHAIDEIDFSQQIPWWATWRMGTTMSPVWITKNEALMLIHGIRIENGIYHYSIGRAKLIKDKGYRVVAIDSEPLITPEHFYHKGSPIYPELHDFRRVVYACGGIIKKIGGDQVLSLFVNVGDSQTVAVDFPLKQLQKDFWIN